MKMSKETVAIITGGASGLGLAAARALCESGVKVSIFDLNKEAGLEVARETGAVFCHVDVTDEASTTEGFRQARERNGQERILVNCAGGGRGGRTAGRDRKTGKIIRLESVDFERIVALNLFSTYRCISLSAAGMLTLEPLEDGERGVITNTSSIAAQDGQVGQVAYSAAKAGIVGMTLTIARDLADEGIRINSIMPGIMNTPPMRGVPEKVLRDLSASVPFPKRLGEPEEFASLLLELVRNQYMNAQSIRLDGALRMVPRP